jgi:dephospho-CoA kinase
MGTGRPVLIGLTGSIGMGKSTTATMFAEEGAAVWDADAAVHRLYGKEGTAVAGIAAMVPDAVRDGQVDRKALREAIVRDPTLLARIEALVHPLVAQDRAAFVEQSSADVVVCDVPLLFETGAEGEFDAIVVVSAPADAQRTRVLARGTMTEEEFDRIVARQMPDNEKRARADRVIETTDPDGARAQVAQIMAEVRADA